MLLLQLLRTLGALAIVLGLLAAALWYVRRYDIRLPGRVTTGSTRRLELVERLALDGRRSAILLRRDGREHLILLGPDGHALIEAGIESPPRPQVAEAAPPPADPFAVLVERAVGRASAAAKAARIEERMARLSRIARAALEQGHLKLKRAFSHLRHSRESGNPGQPFNSVPAFAGVTAPPTAAPAQDVSDPVPPTAAPKRTRARAATASPRRKPQA